MIGFDIEARPYPGQLVLQDVLTIHGRQFKDAAVIVGSSPCQEFSYRAMPWKRAKALPPPYLGMKLFKAQLRIRWEASEAAGREIPLVIENVKGSQPWVGRARANYGSFYLWGDVDSIGGRIVRRGEVRWGVESVRAAARGSKFNPDGTEHGQCSWFAIADSKNRGSGLKLPGNNTPRLWCDREVQRLCDAPNPDGRKVAKDDGKAYGGNFGWDGSPLRRGSSHSSARKAASAQIAKIPFDLARHVARVFKPQVAAIAPRLPTSSAGAEGHSHRPGD